MGEYFKQGKSLQWDTLGSGVNEERVPDWEAEHLRSKCKGPEAGR